MCYKDEQKGCLLYTLFLKYVALESCYSTFAQFWTVLEGLVQSSIIFGLTWKMQIFWPKLRVRDAEARPGM